MKRIFVVKFALAMIVTLAISFIVVGQPIEKGEPDIISHGKNPHAGEAVTAGSTGTVTPKITYHGGALMNTPIIYYIWYGDWNQSNGTDNASGQQILLDFASTVGNSPYYMINTTYSTGGYSITGSVLYGGQTTVGYSKGKRLKDSDILSIVNTAISSGSLPYNQEGVYFVLTSSDVTTTSGFCTRYCGWHTSSAFQQGPQRLRYSFVGNAARCITSCAAQSVGPNGNAGVDGMVSIIAHELEEAATDADPGTNPGWYDSGGAENADKCAWTFGQNIQTIPVGSPNAGAKYNVTLGARNYLIQRNLKQATTGDTCNMSLTTQ